MDAMYQATGSNASGVTAEVGSAPKGSLALSELRPTGVDWAEEFRRLANQCKADTFQLANAAYWTRKRLAHGEWATLWRSATIPFSKTRGEALVQIGERFGIPSVQTSAHLPTEWTILHQLARLRMPLIEQLLAQKIIHPRLTFKQARDLVISILGTRSPRSACTRIQQQLRKLLNCVQEAGGQLSWSDRDGLATQLRALTRRLTKFTAPSAPGELGSRVINLPVTDVSANGSKLHTKAL